MKKNSLRFLQAHTNMASVIDELAPDLFGEGCKDNGDKTPNSFYSRVGYKTLR
jgi:hypothetical protein